MSAERLILVADDDQDSLAITRTILESRGYRVATSINGALAVEAARREPPDLILMDLMMPRTDGWGAVAALKEDPSTAAIPILAISAAEPPLEEVRDAGFCAVLTKPVTPTTILEAIEVCLAARDAGERWIPDLARHVGVGA